MKMQATLGHPILIFLYTFSVFVMGSAAGAHLKRLSGTAFCLAFAGAVLMVIHDMATGILWFWVTATLRRAVYDREANGSDR